MSPDKEHKQSEKLFRESGELLETIINAAQEAIITIADDGSVILFNRAAEAMFGYTKEEMLGKTLECLMPEKYRPDHKGNIENYFGTGKPDGAIGKLLELPGLRASGEEFTMEISLSAGAMGNKHFVVGVARDVTERNRTREALRESEERFRGIFESSNIGIYQTTPDGQILMANPALVKMLGFNSLDELADRNLESHGYEPQYPRSIFKKRIETEGEIVGLESAWLTQDGTKIFVRESARKVDDENGNTLYYAGTVEDISSHKRAEEILRFTQFAVDRTSDEAFWMNQDGSFFYVNDTACKSLGYSREELLQMKVSDIDPDLPVDAWSSHWKKIRKEGTYTFDSHHRSKSGRTYPVEIVTNYLEFDGVEYNCAFARDITRHREAQREQEKAHRLLSEKNKELESIIHIASHDFRVPLVTIRGFAEELKNCCKNVKGLLGDCDIPDDIRNKLEIAFEQDVPESLHFIQAGADKMDMLLESLLKLARLGTEALASDHLDMNKILNNIKQSLAYHIQDTGAEIHIDDLPTCVGDEAQINQVFSNLLANALKYLDSSRKGAIRVSGGVKGDRIVYCVEDNGIGIEAGQQKNVFNIFYRLHTGETDGHGLGLAIVRRITSRHDGQAWVESRFGKGSKFFVALPRVTSV